MVQLGLSICTEAIAVLVSVNVMPELTSQNMEDYTMIQYFIANISCFPIVLGTEKIKRTGQGEEIPGMYWVLLLLLPVLAGTLVSLGELCHCHIQQVPAAASALLFLF